VRSDGRAPIEERFRFDQHIGRGAFADVFRGTNVSTGEPVAIKRLRDDVEIDLTTVARFRLEADWLERIRDPHVVGFVDRGADAHGRQCLVLEWLDGEDLARRLSSGPLYAPMAIEIARQAALGLHALHGAGIVHRDVKPSNLFIASAPDGTVHAKLIDLGIARAAQDMLLTAEGIRIGTPAYMSPEQARGSEAVTARSDLFSLGVVLYEMLSGRRLFRGEDAVTVLAQIVRDERVPLVPVQGELPPDLQAVLTRALRKLPRERFASARAMADALGSLNVPADLSFVDERDSSAGARPPSSGSFVSTPRARSATDPERGSRLGLAGLPTPGLVLLGRRTTMVGRDAEVSMLDSIYEECRDDSVSRAVLVTGAAGVGKSRLRHEWLARLQARGEAPRILFGRGDAVRAGSPFALLAPALRRAFVFRGDEDPATRRDALLSRLPPLLAPADAPRVAMFLSELMGVSGGDDPEFAVREARSDPMRMGDQMRRAWEEWLEAECRAHPVVIALEDLQWGDEPTLRFVDGAIKRLAHRPLLVLGFARPEIRRTFPTLWLQPAAEELVLTALPRGACDRLAREVLGDAADAALVADVVDRAQGNALDLEERLRWLSLRETDPQPDSVQSMLQSRVAALDDGGRNVLAAASVFGRSFWSEGVAHALIASGTLTSLGEVLSDLLERELIQERSWSAFAGVREFDFRHEFIREVCHATLATPDVANANRLSALWLDAVDEPDALAIAMHFEIGGAPKRAVDHYVRAARQALTAGDLPAALLRAERGVACGATHQALGQLRWVQAESSRWRGEDVRASRFASEAATCFDPASDEWYGAIVEVACAAGRLADRSLVARTAEQLLAAPAPQRVGRHAVLAWIRTGLAALRVGDRELARRLFAHVDANITVAPGMEPTLAAWIDHVRAHGATESDDVGVNLENLARSANRFERAGDARTACEIRVDLGCGCVALGAYKRGEKALRAALAVAEEMHLRNVVAECKHGLAHVLVSRGDLTSARSLEEEAAVEFSLRGDERAEIRSRLGLAEIATASGDLARAEHEAQSVLDSCGSAPSMGALALARLASVRLKAGRIGDALELSRRAYEILDERGCNVEGESTVRLVHAEALHASGDFPTARAVIESARARVTAAAEAIHEHDLRASFLSKIADHATILARAHEWCPPYDDGRTLPDIS